jgi:hypothetical protein
MDLRQLSASQRRVVAADPSTDGATLEALAADWSLCSTIVQNPSAPGDLRERIYQRWPELMPTASPSTAAPSSATSTTEFLAARQERQVDDAVAKFRTRAAQQSSTQRGRSPGPARVAYTEVRDVHGRLVKVPTTAVATRTTNGLAVASLVLGYGSMLLLVVLWLWAASAT